MCRKFINRYDESMAPLTKLSGDGTPFLGRRTVIYSLRQPKAQTAGVSCPLSHAHEDNRLVLTNDASTVCVGAELAQRASQGPQPIAFFSRALAKAERNYSTYNRELLGIVLAFATFVTTCSDTRFCLLTDRRRLQYSRRPKTLGIGEHDGLPSSRSMSSP